MGRRAGRCGVGAGAGFAAIDRVFYLEIHPCFGGRPVRAVGDFFLVSAAEDGAADRATQKGVLTRIARFLPFFPTFAS